MRKGSVIYTVPSSRKEHLVLLIALRGGCHCLHFMAEKMLAWEWCSYDVKGYRKGLQSTWLGVGWVGAGLFYCGIPGVGRNTNLYFMPPDAICLALAHLSPNSDKALPLLPDSALMGGLVSEDSWGNLLMFGSR